MSILGRFTVGTKIIAGYVIALALMAVVGGLAIFRIDQINDTVVILADDLAQDQHLSDQIIAQILLSRFHANKYVRDSNSTDLDHFQEKFDVLEQFVAEAEVKITKDERAAMLDDIQQDVTTYKEAFTEVVNLIAAREKVIAETLDVQGPLAEEKLEELRNSTFNEDDDVAAHAAGDALRAFLLMRFDAFKYLQAGDVQWVDLLEARYQETLDAFDTLDAELQNAAHRQLAEEAKTAVDAYYQGFEGLRSGYTRQNQLVNDTMDVVGPQVRTTASNISSSVSVDFDTEKSATETLVAQTRGILLATMAIAIVIGLGLGIIISRAITDPLQQVTEISRQIAEVDLRALSTELGALAQGDLTRSLSITADTVNVDLQDEIGQMAQAFNAMIARLQETGQSFASMVINLQNLIGQVNQSATTLGAASIQLSSTADQAAQATNQVANTMQQIAQGTAQQTNSVTQATSTVEQVARAIDGVARGAQEQASAVNRSAEITGGISSIVQQVAANARAGAEGASNAAQSAHTGAQTVEKTIQGMQAIKSSTDTVAQRIAEMGRRSEQIGVIIETIDDIASQTNLLALNAAIEAARAGEHGKGFAVVADEVRKLAESAAKSTNEIAGLIKSVQATITEAVHAMGQGTSEVEAGMRQADEAGQVLDTILVAAEAVNQQVDQIATAAQQMDVSMNNLVGAMDGVSAVVEENTASTEEMSASAGEVSLAMENIASISEENSAASEEVSATIEEVSAQVEEVTASAQSLASMAQQLQAMVSQFKLPGTLDVSSSGRATPTPAASSISFGDGGNGQGQTVRHRPQSRPGI